MQQRTYIAIDLKSFYASVECVDRGLDPLTTNLVVADESRTEKTICLAVSPSLKTYGIGGRARLFEVYQKARGVEFIIAPPRMAHYIEVSTKVYQTYLKYIAPEDIHVYSIDEVFMDVTAYLRTYKLTAHQLAMKMIRDVLATTGITATAGIGTNMYLAKVAMDIVAKKMPADKDGVRIAELDEMSYRRELWDYRPLTKFWRVGRGIAEKLAVYGIDTMGKIARMSIQNKGLLYRLFGVNAECLTRPEIREKYHGEITTNYYGKAVPKHAHGTFNFEKPTSSSRLIMDGATELFDRCVNPDLLIRRLNLTTNHVVSEASVSAQESAPQQLDLFTDYEALEKQRQEEQAKLDKERRMQKVFFIFLNMHPTKASSM